MLAASSSPLRGRLLPRLLSGELVAGIAFAYLRHYPDRPVRARRAEGGWVVTGTAPWYTGWGLNDVALVAALADDDTTVWGFVDATPDRGLLASERIETLAIAGAQTVRLTFDHVEIPDADVVARIPLDDWRAGDDARSSDTVPAVFGVTAAAARLLAAAGERSPEAAELADLLTARLDEARARAYGLADAGAPLDERREARAESYALLTAATTAAVAATGGRAIAPGAAAGRLARAGLFLLVQAQTGPIRARTLQRWSSFLRKG
jgi:alkylation response protein AidB-like acyl-CoA dehydrogenase